MVLHFRDWSVCSSSLQTGNPPMPAGECPAVAREMTIQGHYSLVLRHCRVGTRLGKPAHCGIHAQGV